MGYPQLILVALLAIIVPKLWKIFVSTIWRPYNIRRLLRKQGLRGPKAKFLSGSHQEMMDLEIAARDIEIDIHSHDLISRISPQYNKWIAQYGETFFYTFGTETRLVVSDPELAKQVLWNKSGFYLKPKADKIIMSLIGKGLTSLEGSDWTRHRKIVSPAFNMDKLKIMTKQMAECTMSMLDNWHGQIVDAEGHQKEIDVNRQFEELTADVISVAAFGSDCSGGKEVFLAQTELEMLIVLRLLKIQFPWSKYLPSESNRRIWKLRGKIRNVLANIIRSRLKSQNLSYGNDLLGSVMESSRKEEGCGLTMEEIIEECKTFFFAGHASTSHLLTWTIFLLSINQDWQERLREEVVSECGKEVPNAANLSKFKLVTMVILETLRLYSPAGALIRHAVKDMELGGLLVPKDTMLSIPIMIIHRNKELWGDDAYKFNPQRFENGVTMAAKQPNALLGFSTGPRSCIGQNLAMMEAKMVIAMILQRFSFSLSKDYKHKPMPMLTLHPEQGLPIVFKPLAV